MTSSTTLSVAPSTMSTVSLYDYMSRQKVTLPVNFLIEANEFACKFLSPWEKSYYSIELNYASCIAPSLKKLNITRYKHSKRSVCKYSIIDLLKVHEDRYGNKYNRLKNEYNILERLSACSSLSDLKVHEGTHVAENIFQLAICQEFPLIHVEGSSWLNSEEGAVINDEFCIDEEYILFKTGVKSNLIWDTEGYTPLISVADMTGVRELICSALETNSELKYHLDKLSEIKDILSDPERRYHRSMCQIKREAGRNKIFTEVLQTLIKDNKIPIEIYYTRKGFGTLAPYISKDNIRVMKTLIMHELDKRFNSQSTIKCKVKNLLKSEPSRCFTTDQIARQLGIDRVTSVGEAVKRLYNNDEVIIVEFTKKASILQPHYQIKDGLFPAILVYNRNSEEFKGKFRGVGITSVSDFCKEELVNPTFFRDNLSETSVKPLYVKDSNGFHELYVKAELQEFINTLKANCNLPKGHSATEIYYEIQKIFDNNVNETFNTKGISEKTGWRMHDVRVCLKALIANNKIKIVSFDSINHGLSPRYQSINGNLSPLIITHSSSKKYRELSSINEFKKTFYKDSVLTEKTVEELGIPVFYTRNPNTGYNKKYRIQDLKNLQVALTAKGKPDIIVSEKVQESENLRKSQHVSNSLRFKRALSSVTTMLATNVDKSFTCKEISEEIGETPSFVSSILRALKDGSEIKIVSFDNNMSNGISARYQSIHGKCAPLEIIPESSELCKELTTLSTFRYIHKGSPLTREFIEGFKIPEFYIKGSCSGYSKRYRIKDLEKLQNSIEAPTTVQKESIPETPKEPLPNMQEMEEIKTLNILGFQISIKRKKKIKSTDFDIIEF